MKSQLNRIWRNFVNKLKVLFEFIGFLFVPKSSVFRAVFILIVFSSTLAFGYNAWAADDGLVGTILDLFNSVLLLITQMLGWVLMKLFALVVVISSYNDFVTSAAVVKGWVLVRDVVNLFFVLILLVIAFAQILHVEKYSLKQILPNLLIAAILVNFSKLICGLIIDFGQVVMMTFVNGYAATAGANLVNGLGLAKILALKESGGANVPGSMDVFIALFVAVFVMIMTIIVTFFILLLLLLRIVQLWILVVLSPAAFVLEAVPIGGLKSKAAEWWQKFGWSVAVGPFMAFFLWLSLMVMSNPDETITANYAAVEEKSAGSVVSGFTYMNNLAQAAIGLAMLFASLMIAQEAGGIVGNAAGKFQGMAKSAAGAVARKMSGYGAVADRAGAVYGGWAAKRQEAKKQTLAKYSRFGEGVAAKQARVTSAVKKAAGLPVRMTAVPIKKVTSYLSGIAGRGLDSARGKAGGILAGLKTKAGLTVGGTGIGGKVARFGVGAGAFIAKKWSRGGVADTIAADAIEQQHHDARVTEGNSEIESRGISSPDDLRQAMMDASEHQAVRIAAAIKLAKSGEFKDMVDEKGNVVKSAQDQANEAKKLLDGNRKGSNELEESMLAKQAHLAFDLKTDEGQDKMKNAIIKGKVDVSKQQLDAYKDADFMKAALAALGGKAFGKSMEKVSDVSAEHSDAVSKTTAKLAEAEIPKLQSAFSDLTSQLTAANAALAAAAGAATPDPAAIAAATAERDRIKTQNDKAKGDLDNFRKTTANITKSWDEGYAERKPDGKVDAGNYSATSKEAMLKHLNSADEKQLGKMELSSSFITNNVMDIKLGTISKMMSSGEEKGIATANEILNKLLARKAVSTDAGERAKIKSMLKQAVKNNRIADNMDDGVRSKCRAI